VLLDSQGDNISGGKPAKAFARKSVGRPASRCLLHKQNNSFIMLLVALCIQSANTELVCLDCAATDKANPLCRLLPAFQLDLGALGTRSCYELADSTVPPPARPPVTLPLPPPPGPPPRPPQPPQRPHLQLERFVLVLNVSIAATGDAGSQRREDWLVAYRHAIHLAAGVAFERVKVVGLWPQSSGAGQLQQLAIDTILYDFSTTEVPTAAQAASVLEGNVVSSIPLITVSASIVSVLRTRLSPPPPAPQPPAGEAGGLSLGVAATVLAAGVSVTIGVAIIAFCIFWQISGDLPERGSSSEVGTANVILPGNGTGTSTTASAITDDAPIRRESFAFSSLLGVGVSAVSLWADIVLSIDMLHRAEEQTMGAWMLLALVIYLLFCGGFVLGEVAWASLTGQHCCCSTCSPKRRPADWIDLGRWQKSIWLGVLVWVLSLTNLHMLSMLPWREGAFARLKSSSGYAALPEWWMFRRVVLYNTALFAVPQFVLQTVFLGTFLSFNPLLWSALFISVLNIIFHFSYWLLHFEAASTNVSQAEVSVPTELRPPILVTWHTSATRPSQTSRPFSRRRTVQPTTIHQYHVALRRAHHAKQQPPTMTRSTTSTTLSSSGSFVTV